ncbi:lipase [Plantactinospora sp. DSM 117369]
MKKTLFTLGGVAVLTAMAVLASTTASAAANRGGRVVSGRQVLGLEPQQVKEFLEPLGVYVPQARHGVDAYQVVYRTVDVRGRSTTASSLVALPRTGDRRLRPAVWLHGTQSYRLDAPSVSECCDRAAAVLFASLGYAATAPDYLGLGAGPGTHPYFHAETAVSASVDALRATRHFAVRYGRTVGGPVAVAGFSQGANNSFLLARALQRGADRNFSLGALAPISGAYHLFDVEWPAAIGGDVDPKAATYYLAYLTVAWNRIYHLYGAESEVFQEPYAGNVADLFDGEHTIEESMAGLPAKPSELLRPEYAELLLQPTGRLAGAARANDDACLGWRPAVPVRMYAAHGDPEAVYANSERCQRELRGVGADVTLTDVGDVDHITSLVLSVPQVATWFATLR